MNTTEAELAATLPSTIAVAPAKQSSCAATMRCMLVTQELGYTAKFKRSALEEGWSVDIFTSVDEAIRAAFLRVFQLAVVDLQSVVQSPRRTDFEQLARDLAENHVSLLVVAGDPHDPLAEIIARQLGVWVYLPGIDSAGRLDEMFREARIAIGRLASKQRNNERPVEAGKPPDL